MKVNSILLASLLLAAPVYASEGETNAQTPTKAEKSGEPSATFAAKETTCKQDSRVRKVKVGYKDETQGGDCAVTYSKESEEPGAEKVLWSAQRQPEYCQEKADSFVQKLEGMGWTCN